MGDDPISRLKDAELKAFLDAMYPNGVDGADVMHEIAPEGWEQSPLVGRMAALGARRRRASPGDTGRVSGDLELITPPAEPTLASVQADWEAQPIKPLEELAELVGLCLWDVFSDNHEVLDVDGR